MLSKEFINVSLSVNKSQVKLSELMDYAMPVFKAASSTRYTVSLASRYKEEAVAAACRFNTPLLQVVNQSSSAD